MIGNNFNHLNLELYSRQNQMRALHQPHLTLDKFYVYVLPAKAFLNKARDDFFELKRANDFSSQKSFVKE